jgi:hypothetical protein
MSATETEWSLTKQDVNRIVYLMNSPVDFEDITGIVNTGPSCQEDVVKARYMLVWVLCNAQTPRLKGLKLMAIAALIGAATHTTIVRIQQRYERCAKPSNLCPHANKLMHLFRSNTMRQRLEYGEINLAFKEIFGT